MKILGISGSLVYKSNHDCSTALVVDGKLIENIEEERFNRIKHSEGKFPFFTIKEVLSKHNLTMDDIDAIGIPFDPYKKEKFVKEFMELVAPDCKKIPQFFYKNHHTAHLYDAFYQSGFESAVGVIIDGSGDLRDGITIGQFTKDNKFKILKVYDVSKSLGELYSACASYCGYGDWGEGKIMGLSSFGRPKDEYLLKWNDKTKNIDINYPLILDEDNISADFVHAGIETFLAEKIYPYASRYYEDYDAESKINFGQEVMYYADTAATIQKNFNEIYLNVVKYAKELTGEDNLVLAGGCVQNCIGNNIVVESGLFKNVYATPAPHDAGCGAGLAFYAADCMGEKIENKRLTISYTGREYSDEEILSKIDKEKFKITEYNEKEMITMFHQGAIIGWFQGGSEIGPRALGHRSILASPHDRENLYIINNFVKNRELFRPLAPTIPNELFDKVFDVKSKDLTEFMLRTIEIRPEYRKVISAVCHVDNTTRPQCLRNEDNPELYSLIMNYYKSYNIPCLINTSFNGRGQPIIETPEQALKFLEDKEEYMDGVVFNGKIFVTIK